MSLVHSDTLTPPPKKKRANIISLLGYTVTEDEVIPIINFVDGSNLDLMLFGKKEYREVSVVKPPQIRTCLQCMCL